MGERLSKPVAAVLERCFAAESDITRPEACRIGQWRKVTKPLQKALDLGFVVPVQTEMAATRASPFATTFKGYILTHAGHYAFGCWAAENCPTEPEVAASVEGDGGE